MLSNRVGKVLQSYGEQFSETANFVLLSDRFFDCLNGRYQNQDLATKKPDLAAYKSLDDPRFQV